MGESGDSGQSSWVLESLVERLGFEAWRRGDWEEMQLGTCQIKTRGKKKKKNITLTGDTVKITVFQQSVCIRSTWRVDLVSFPLFLDRHFLCLFSFLGSS